MTMTSSELKLRARRSLYGNYGSLAGLQILVAAVSMAVTPLLYVILIPLVFGIGVSGVEGSIVFGIAFICVFLAFYLVLLFAGMMIGAGYCKIFLELSQARLFRAGDLLHAFKNRPWRFARLFLAMFLCGFAAAVPQIICQTMYIFAGLPAAVLLFIVLLQQAFFLWLGTSLSQSCYIMIENREFGAFACMKESFHRMVGNRLRLIRLWISFIGWYILAFCTFGVGMIWVTPYVGCASAHFYLDLRERRRIESEIRMNSAGADEKETEVSEE